MEGGSDLNLNNKNVIVGTAVGVVSAAILMVGAGVDFEPFRMILLGSGLVGSGLTGLIGYRRKKRMI